LPDHNVNNSDRPSVCRNCGALIGAGESSCHVCGAPLIQPAAASLPLPERYAVSYARAVLSRPYIFTIAFLVANLFVFLLMWQSSGLSMSSLVAPFSEGVLLDYGAKKNYFIFFEHQYWRFVTPMFVHVHVLHLLVNMYGLWIIGPWVEKLYGSAKFVVLWGATGVAGVVVSYLTVIPGPPRGLIASFLIRTTDNPSAGASGALFGMIGVLFVFGIKYRRELPEGFKRAFGAGMLPVIMLNLGIGFLARDFVDNGAHLGGLLSGAALASVISYKRPGASTRVTIAWRVLQVAALLLVMVCFGMAVRAAQRHPRPSPKQVQAAREAEYQTFYANNNAFRSGEAAAISALESGDLSGLAAGEGRA